MPNLKCKDEVMINGLEERVIEDVEVKGIYSTYLEVCVLAVTNLQAALILCLYKKILLQARECSPKLSKIQVVLEPSSFKGLEYEKSIDKSTLYDWDRLRSQIQASDGEILAALPEYLVVCMDGIFLILLYM